MKSAVVVAALLVSTVACDHIPGLGKKDGGDEGGASSGSGGILSFLGSDKFEGEITMSVTGKGQQGPMTLVFGIKQPKFRIDMSAGQQAAAAANPMLAQGGSFIIDPPSKKGYMLVNAKKQAMMIDFAQIKATRAAHPGGAGGTSTGTAPDPNDVPKIEKTGKKETIAGYECEDWKVTTKKTHADMCVAEGIKWFDVSDLGMAAPTVALAGALSELNHFPLKMVGYDETGAEDMHMEAQKIEKKKLDDSRFQVPAGFQVIDMTQMINGFANMGTSGLGGAPGTPPGLPPGFKLPTPPAKH